MCSTEDHHDNVVFLGEIVVLNILGGTGVGRVWRLILLDEVSLHEVTVLHGMLDRSLVVRTRCLKHLLEVIPRGTSLLFGQSFVDHRHQVAVVELALWASGRSLTLLLLRLPLAESDDFLPVGVVGGQIKELVDGFWLDSPYPMDKGLARGTILESGDDLVVGRVGELSATLGEAANVVKETLTLILLAMAKFARIARPRVGTLEVPYEGMPELVPVVDPPSREVLEPGTCRVGEVQWDALDDEQIVGRAAIVAGEAIVFKSYTWVGLLAVLHDGGGGAIPSLGIRSENAGAEGLRTSGVRRRALAPVLTVVVAAPTPPAVLPSRSAFAVRPASGPVVRVDLAVSGRAHALRTIRLPRRA
jgi:hypothetical protein